MIDEKVEPIAVYNEFRASLGELKQLNESVVFDYQSKEGDKAARSHVYKLRQTKTAVDGARKSEKEESLAYGRRVDGEAKEIITEIEQMITVHQVRIDEVAAVEKDRIEAHINGIEAIADLGRKEGSVDVLNGALTELEAVTLDDRWEEFEDRATTVWGNARMKLLDGIAEEEKAEADRAELQALREEATKLREAEAERQCQDEEKEREAEAARQAEVAAVEAKEREEAAQKKAEEMAAKAVKDAETRLAREAEEKENAAALADQAAADNAKNRNRVHKAIEKALIEYGLEEHKRVVEALASGAIPHIKILY